MPWLLFQGEKAGNGHNISLGPEGVRHHCRCLGFYGFSLIEVELKHLSLVGICNYMGHLKVQGSDLD